MSWRHTAAFPARSPRWSASRGELESFRIQVQTVMEAVMATHNEGTGPGDGIGPSPRGHCSHRQAVRSGTSPPRRMPHEKNQDERSHPLGRRPQRNRPESGPLSPAAQWPVQPAAAARIARCRTRVGRQQLYRRRRLRLRREPRRPPARGRLDRKHRAPRHAGQDEIAGRREHWTNHDLPSRESLGTRDNWRALGSQRRAEDRVDGTSSVRHVQNNLRVKPDAPDASRWSEAGKSGPATPGGAPNGAARGTSAGTAASGTGAASTATTSST